jgi:hypothetical protein
MEQEKNKLVSSKSIALVAGILILIGVLVLVFSGKISLKQATRAERYQSFYQASLVENNPKELQNFFTEEVKQGRNDELVKAAAYFITHRYFDSKGNIYELYAYSHSDPALSFLVKAEAIYPDIFNIIKNKGLPETYSESGNYAYLAYLEVLANKGYADVAVFGTAANQYAKLAYIPLSSGNHTKQSTQNINKSLFFANKAKSDVATIVKGAVTKPVYQSNIVVGLNQYAHALRYYKAMSVPFDSPVQPEEVFTFTTNYTTKYVPELYLFTSILNTSSLVMVKADSSKIEEAVKPVVLFDTKISKPRSYSVIDRIISSRTGKEEEGIYSKKNIAIIAKASPSFKSWLVLNGWSESDFN